MTGNLWQNIRMKRLYCILVLLLLGVFSVSSCIPSSLSCSSDPEPTPVDTGPCRADFYAEPTHRTDAGYVVVTSTSTGNIKTLRWDFGNGRTGVGRISQTYYNKNGYYTITLTIDGPDCHDTITKVDYIEISGC
jgi:PKD repeat protein